jgi:outer membrane protein, heavy metal efflux system
MRDRPRFTLLWVCAFGIVAATAAGSDAAAVPLTIDEAVKEALDHNLTIVAERFSIAVADAHILTAQLRPNPVFTTSAMLPDSTTFGNNISPREEVFRTDVVIEGGGKRERRIEVAQAARSVAELQFLNTMRTIVLEVQQAFVDVVLARENLTLANQSLGAFKSLVTVNVERVRTGDLAQVELVRSRLAALQFQNDVRLSEAKLAVAHGKLNTLLGRDRGSPIDAAGELRRDAQPVDVEALRTRAIDRRPDLQALRSDQARSTADLRLQIAQGKVDYTISGEVHHQHQPGPPDATGFQYGIYASVPLPIFNRNQGEVARARSENTQIEARIRALEADINQEVDAAYAGYQAAHDVVSAIETQMLDQAREVRTTTEYSYRRGEATFVEFLDAVRAFNETMQSYNEARAEFARSLYTLDSIGGAPSPAPIRVTP